MSDIKQLWSFTTDKCVIAAYGTIHGIKKRVCKNAPVMEWPDGTVCWPVTSWLLDKYKRISTKSARGGSAGTYASLLSSFVRFCYKNKIAFVDINDDHFFQWAEALRNERNEKAFKRRNNTQIGRIMRKAIEFLIWYQDNQLFDKIIVGTKADGAQLKITFKEGQRGKFKFTYIDHPAIPKNDVAEEVKPISHSVITKLYDSIHLFGKAPFIRKRLQQQLRILEATGGRRIEISKITVDDIYRALKTERLRMYTAKSQTDKYRVVPVPKMWIEPIIVFIEGHRKKLVAKLIANDKLVSDPGHLFISATTGQPLSEETLTSEMSKLRRIAGIDEKTCGHMFRHRFITLQVIYRLKAYVGQALPMDVAKVILTKVASITGHKDPMSLMPYIDLAFQEMGVWDTAEKVLHLKSKTEAALRQVQTFTQDVIDGKLRGKKLVDLVTQTLQGILSGLDAMTPNDLGLAPST
jgi:integrase